MAALGLPGLALDLPGHGQSPWTADHDHSPRRLAGATVRALRALAPEAALLVGMSLGGMVAAAVADQLPNVARIVLIDVTPSSIRPAGSNVGTAAALPAAALDELVRQVHQASPERDVVSLRHSIWHATRPLPGGLRTWRADPRARVGSFADLWPDVERQAARTHLVLAEEGSFVPPDDVPRLARLLGDDHIHLIPGSTHSIQSTRPRALSETLRLLAADSI
jgi:pimeloyl-ACP methyl ester carboxylesterase